MSIELINAENFVSLKKSHPVLDVRSPSEYNCGHIPDAINFPLFSDEERSIIGTTYKKSGARLALLTGLEMVGPRLSNFVLRAEDLNVNGTFLMHCWRGGKRSSSLAWLLSNAGFEIKLLMGGYKAYRTLAHKIFDQPDWKFFVLGGKTGSMKSKVLTHLSNQSEQVIDLESLASHKGSAFGWINESAQPSTEQFENLLFEKLITYNSEKPIWCENESKTIGKVYIPNSIWNQIQKGILFHLEVDYNIRLNHILSTYNFNNGPDLILSFEKIRKRLGHMATDQAIKHIQNNQIEEAAKIGLDYYDKFYDYGLNKKISSMVFKLKIENDDVNNICDSLVQFKNQINLHEYFSSNSI